MNFYHENLLVIRSFLSKMANSDGTFGFNCNAYSVSRYPLADLFNCVTVLNNYNPLTTSFFNCQNTHFLFLECSSLLEQLPFHPEYLTPTHFVRPVYVFRWALWLSVLEHKMFHEFLVYEGVRTDGPLVISWLSRLNDRSPHETNILIRWRFVMHSLRSRESFFHHRLIFIRSQRVIRPLKRHRVQYC